MYRQFNIHNSTFCPHSVFMCFVWISEQTAIISLHNINWLVCITQRQSVYCAVRTGCWQSAAFQCSPSTPPPPSLCPFLVRIQEWIPHAKTNKVVINDVHLQTFNFSSTAPTFTRLHSFTFSPAVTQSPRYSAVNENEGTFQQWNVGACQRICSRAWTFELERLSTLRHVRAFCTLVNRVGLDTQQELGTVL